MATIKKNFQEKEKLVFKEMKNYAPNKHNFPFLDSILYASYLFSNGNFTKKHKNRKIQSTILHLYRFIKPMF
jgi:hypothetical protein